MRILALDHGAVRIGVAVSDELKIIAQPLEFIPAEDTTAALKRLLEILRDKEVELILVGMPRNMDGSYGPAAEKVRAFVREIQAITSVGVRTWDERLTSTQANRVLVDAGVRREKRKEKVDAMAAAVLLQSFLDCQSG
ncbi:MAG: Holliday junction resolvase RuvX [Verrucomicrobia bacterium]|nr:Holliday junction resolvase RuvX [Verrucomicrobiota bacterium]MBI3867205.1 Holliday junction resolvase RuvX [Verrucomicrobiota bacterium]